MDLCTLQASFILALRFSSVLRSHSVGLAVHASWTCVYRGGGEGIVSANVGPRAVAPLQRRRRRAPR